MDFFDRPNAIQQLDIENCQLQFFEKQRELGQAHSDNKYSDLFQLLS